MLLTWKHKKHFINSSFYYFTSFSENAWCKQNKHKTWPVPSWDLRSCGSWHKRHRVCTCEPWIPLFLPFFSGSVKCSSGLTTAFAVRWEKQTVEDLIWQLSFTYWLNLDTNHFSMFLSIRCKKKKKKKEKGYRGAVTSPGGWIHEYTGWGQSKGYKIWGNRMRGRERHGLLKWRRTGTAPIEIKPFEFVTWLAH